MLIRLSTIATAAVAAGTLGLALITGMATAGSADDESLNTTVLASCEYTDRTNCDYDGEY